MQAGDMVSVSADDLALVMRALSDAEACFGYDHGMNDEAQEARYETWWEERGEVAAENGTTSEDVRRDMIEALRVAQLSLRRAGGAR